MDDARLVGLVRDHPCLFNPKHHQYKDANARDNVWREIGVKLKHPAEDCKNRWKNIRDTYMRRKKVKKHPTGSGTSKKGRKWYLEEYIDFLTVADCETETVTNSNTQVAEPQVCECATQNVRPTDGVSDGTPEREDFELDEPEDPNQHDDDGDTILIKANTQNPSNQPGGGIDAVSEKPNKRKAPTKLSGENMKVFKKNVKDSSKMMSLILDKPQEQHPIDVFFHSMAMTVKTLSPENQVRAKMQICQTVSQLELEELNLPRYNIRSSTSDDSNTTFHPVPIKLDGTSASHGSSFKN